MKIRIKAIISEGGNIWYFPQVYYKPFLFGLFGGWKDFIEEKGVDPLGFPYPDGSVKFFHKKDVIKFLKNKLLKKNCI